jgi:hypothetical protein
LRSRWNAKYAIEAENPFSWLHIKKREKSGSAAIACRKRETIYVLKKAAHAAEAIGDSCPAYPKRPSTG